MSFLAWLNAFCIFVSFLFTLRSLPAVDGRPDTIFATLSLCHETSDLLREAVLRLLLAVPGLEFGRDEAERDLWLDAVRGRETAVDGLLLGGLVGGDPGLSDVIKSEGVPS